MADKTLVISGITGIGKSLVATRTAARVAGRILAVDSVQAFRHMVIGSNMDPTHGLTGMYAPSDHVSVYTLAEAADAAISETRAAGRLPILVGGSGFYLSHVMRLSCTKKGPQAPPNDPSVFQDVAKELEGMDWTERVERLHKVDKVYANSLSANDNYRLIRALVCHRVSGRALSEFEPVTLPETTLDDIPDDIRALFYYDEDLQRHRRVISLRCEEMLRKGLVRETARLVLDHDLSPLSTPGRAIGYRQTISMIRHLGDTVRDADILDLFRSIVFATSRYTAKQRQWARQKDPHLFLWADVDVSATPDVIQVLSSPQRIHQKRVLDRDNLERMEAARGVGEGLRVMGDPEPVLLTTGSERASLLLPIWDILKRAQAKLIQMEEAQRAQQ